LVLDLEQMEFIDELPVSAQVPICGGTESRGLGVGEVSFHVDEGGDTPPTLVLPDLAHEGPIEVWASFHDGVDALVTDELSEDLGLGSSVEHCGEDARTCEGARQALLSVRKRWLLRENPPGVTVSEKRLY